MRIGLHGKWTRVVGEVWDDQVGDTDAGASLAFVDGRNPAVLDTAVAGATACRAVLEHQGVVVWRSIEDGIRAAPILGEKHA